MDDIVKAALAKWPNVPDCYGWLGFDARGNWYMRENLRFMLNLIESRNRDRLADANVDRTRAVTGRLQYDF